MANVLKRDRQRAVLHLVTEGASIRAAERLSGVHRDTICRLIIRFGDACRDFLDQRMRGLTLAHLEVDELWTFVAKKQARLTVDERRERSDIGDVYFWLAIDQTTKLVPSFALGKRSADNARRFMVDVASRLVFPGPVASDPRNWQPGGYQPITQISVDGFAGYPEAIDLAFGPYARYGVIIKDYRNAVMPYTPSEMVGTTRTGRRGIAKREEWTICTSHIERHNLTVRTFMRRFTRLSLGFSKRLENLAAACAMYLAYYNYCWQTRKPGKSGEKRPTAAMMTGLAGHVWSFNELFDTILAQHGTVK